MMGSPIENDKIKPAVCIDLDTNRKFVGMVVATSYSLVDFIDLSPNGALLIWPIRRLE